MTIIMSLEGVLRNDKKAPIPEGIKLFRALVANYRVVISSESSRQETEHWLKSNFVFDYGNVFCKEDSHVAMPIKMRHLDLAHQDGRLELFICADAEMCAQALSKGVASVLFTTPKYIKSFRDVKSWDSLTEEQARQKMFIAEKYIDVDGDLNRWE